MMLSKMRFNNCEIILTIDQFSTNIQGNRMGIPVERIIAEVTEELNHGESYSSTDTFKLEETFKTHLGV